MRSIVSALALEMKELGHEVVDVQGSFPQCIKCAIFISPVRMAIPIQPFNNPGWITPIRCEDVIIKGIIE